MVNPASYPREAYVIIYRAGTAGTYYTRENDTGRLRDWELDLAENFPVKLTVKLENNDPTPASNFLSSSCALWTGSVTGAVDLGDEIRFAFYKSDGSIETYFRGIITDLQNLGGDLQITAYDWMKRLDSIKSDRVFYKNFRKLKEFTVTDSDGYQTIESFSDANVSYPFVEVFNSSGEEYPHLGDGVAGTAYNLATDTDRLVAQPFVAGGMVLWRLYIWYTCVDFHTGGTVDSFRVYLVNDDNGLPAPVGSAIKTWDVQANSSDETNYKEIVSVSPSNDRQFLVEGERYWLVFKSLTEGGTRELYIDAEGIGTVAYQGYLLTSDYGVNWSIQSGDQLHLEYGWREFESCGPTDYLFIDDANRVTLLKQYNWTSGMALLSYYYGTLTLEELVTAICKMNTGMLVNASTNLDIEFKTYATRGKSSGDCLRELMDTYEVDGSWSSRQHVMANYHDGTCQRLKVGKRLDIVNDGPAVTVSHPDDSANTDEYLVIGDPELAKTSKMKYSEVIVIGKGENGLPIIAVRSDKAKGGSFYSKLQGFTEALKITDENIRTLTDANAEAYRLLDAVKRDVWEGNIILSGIHTALWDFDTSSASFGSGNILALTWSPLGISGTPLKVTRLIMRADKTSEVYVNNVDFRLLNRLSQGLGRIEKSESFLAPVGTPKTSLLETYYGTQIAETRDLTMTLYDEDGTKLVDGHFPVTCTKFIHAGYNLKTYHAEFERPNGSSADHKVRYIELTDPDGNQEAYIDLNRTVSSIVINEMVDKYRGNRLVVVVNTPYST